MVTSWSKLLFFAGLLLKEYHKNLAVQLWVCTELILSPLCCACKSMFRLVKEHLYLYLLKAQDTPYSSASESLMSRCWELKWARAHNNVVLVRLWGQSRSGILACWLCSLKFTYQCVQVSSPSPCVNSCLRTSVQVLILPYLKSSRRFNFLLGQMMYK